VVKKAAWQFQLIFVLYSVHACVYICKVLIPVCELAETMLFSVCSCVVG